MITRPKNYPGWNDALAKLVKAEVTADKPIVQASRSHTIMQLLQLLKDNENQVILEIGCSTGNTLKALREVFPKTRLLGADYAYQPLKDIYAHQSDLSVIQLDIVNCPLFDEVVDGLIILNVLEHIENDKAAIEQICRVLKPGGILVVEVPAMPNLYDVFDKHVMHFRRYSMSGLTSMLAEAGFEILTNSHLGFLVYPIFWVGKKRNKGLLNTNLEEQRKAALHTLRRGKKSLPLKYAFIIEAFLRRLIYLPVGIRCLVTCRKPV